MKKTLVLILCIALLSSIFAGCRSEESQDDTTPAAVEETANGETEDNVNGIDFGTVFLEFEPDTLMLTIGDYEVKWAELYYYIHNNVGMYASGFGEYMDDWFETMFENAHFSDLMLVFSVENAQMTKSFEYGATLNGVSLSEQDMEFLRAEYEIIAEIYGGEDNLLKILWEQDGCYSRELFEYLFGASYLARLVYIELYGENGELFSDEDAAIHMRNAGYLMAKHILIMKSDDDEDDTALTEIKNILSQLKTYQGSDFGAFFDELMNTHSEDIGGLLSYPDGYLFSDGDMVEEFYEACVELVIGEISEIVETAYGYHIIYRLPLNFDIVPYTYARYGDYRTLRAHAADAHFDNLLQEWQWDMAVVYTTEFESIDVKSLFINSN